MLAALAILSLIATADADAPVAPTSAVAANSHAEQLHSAPEHDDTVRRHRRGDPSRTLASAPQLVVAIPPQISTEDLKYWFWVLGVANLDEGGLTTAFDDYRQRNDSLRSEALPGIFASAIAAASPPENWSSEQAKNAARAIEKSRNKFLADEATADRALFEELARLSRGAIDPAELAALRNRDVSRLYPETLVAARIDVGRMVRSLASSAAISAESGRVAALILRGGLQAAVATNTHQVRVTSEVIADGCLLELLHGMTSSGGQVAAAEFEGAKTRNRRAIRDFAESSEQLARQSRALVDDIAAGLTEADATTVRRRFESEVYGDLATPPIDGDAIVELIGAIPDETARSGAEAIARDWLASNARRQQEACRALDTYRAQRLSSPRRDRAVWALTANRIADLHSESERALLPITAFIVSAMNADGLDSTQSKVDSLISAGRRRSEQQLDSIDPHFSRTRIDPTREGIRVGKPVDIKATQQDRREAPSPGTQGPPSGGTP